MTANRYGAANARRETYVDYIPDPALPVRRLMDDIAKRLLGGQWAGHHYPSGPGTPEESFTGYAMAAPHSIPTAFGRSGLGAGSHYQDTALNMMPSGISDTGHGDVTRALFADRLRRRGVAV